MGKKRKKKRAVPPKKLVKKGLQLSEFGQKLEAALKQKETKGKVSKPAPPKRLTTKKQVSAREPKPPTKMPARQAPPPGTTNDRSEPKSTKRSVKASQVKPGPSRPYATPGSKRRAKNGFKTREPSKKAHGKWENIPDKKRISLKLKPDKENKDGREGNKGKLRYNFQSWQICGGYPESERDTVIGFDFGTACTKIVLQDSQLKKAVAVPFPKYGHQTSPYLLPTTVYASDDGYLGLDPGGVRIDGIKLSLLESQSKKLLSNTQTKKSATALEIAVGYVALVLMEVREWFFTNRQKEYQNILINWELNIGLPSRSYDNTRLCDLMKLVGLGAWNVSLGATGPPSIARIKKALRTAKSHIESDEEVGGIGELHPDYVTPVPEIIAEVVGYFKSPLRSPGMYLLVDIGASTFDVSTFLLHEKSGDDLYPILTAEVANLGAYRLHEHRIVACKKIFEEKLQKIFSEGDGITPIPDINRYFPGSQEKSCLIETDESFMHRCSLLIRKVVKVTKQDRNPLSEAWEQGLPVFLCGGGSLDDTYSKMVIKSGEKLKRASLAGFVTKQIPKPHNLENTDVTPDDYNRLTVAYGLSFSGVSVGDIIPPSDIGDYQHEPEYFDTEQAFVSKEMV